MHHLMSIRLLLIATAFLSLAWIGIAVFVLPRQLEIVQHDLRSDPKRAGLRVVQLSDLHLQIMGPYELKVILQVQSLRPDLLVLSGDMVDRVDALPVLEEFLTAVGPLRTVAVLGNWEHWSGVDLNGLHKLLELRSEGRFLLNERWSFKHGDRVIEVVGLDDFTAGQPDLQMLTPGEGVEVSLLVQHSPGFFDKTVVGQRMSGVRFELCLSGHTHGGQIAFWGWAPFRPVGSGRFMSDFYDVPGCRLFVSKGVGTSVLPVRWGAAPEVVVFEL
jgi:predicted MPP superfamily phosphohydrolase